MEKLVPALRPGDVVVMDNASYHSFIDEKIPTRSSKKQDMKAWLEKKGTENAA